MSFWLWLCKRALLRLLSGVVQWLLAGTSAAGIVYYLLRVVFSVVPDPIGESTQAGLLQTLIAGLGIGITAVSGLGLFAYRRKTSAQKELRRKMCRIRDMFDCLDIFEEEATRLASSYTKNHPITQDDDWNTLVGCFQQNILQILIGSILKTESPGTAMMERTDGVLEIAATYPSGHSVDTGLVIRLVPLEAESRWPCSPEGGVGVAGYAACRGLPVYVPYTQSHGEWGVTCSPAAQPESEMRFEKIGPPLWKKPLRKNLKSMICAPAATLVNTVPNREWKRYAVINVEGTRRDQFDTDDIHAVAVAANVMAQGLEHSRNCETN